MSTYLLLYKNQYLYYILNFDTFESLISFATYVPLWISPILIEVRDIPAQHCILCYSIFYLSASDVSSLGKNDFS